MSQTQKITPRVIATVWRHWKTAFKKSKFLIAGTIFFYSLAMYFELMYQPVQVKKVFDSLTMKSDPWPAFHLILIAIIAGWSFNRLGDLCVVFGESKIIKHLKDYCMKGLLGKSTHFFSTHSSGGLVAKSKRFANVSENVIDEFVFSIIRSVFFVLYLVIYSSILIPELAPAFIIWVLIFLTMMIIMSRIRMKHDLESSKADSETTSHVSDILMSVFTLRTFGAIPQVQKTFSQVTKNERSKRHASWFRGNIQWAIQSALVATLQLYCLSFIIHGVNTDTYTIGTAVLIQSYIASLTMYMWGLGRSLIHIRTAFADAYEMSSLLDEPDTEPIQYDNEKTVPNTNGIIFSGVTFGYNKDREALTDFSFAFLPGRRYGVVGRTGSGKSTLTKLILRAYDRKSGVISVCDEAIENLNKLELRSWISYVPQDPQFPSWTVKEIISMGSPNASMEDIRLAAEKANCDFIWEKLSKGFDTTVGERGIRLSGGERQRLAIAAAILKNAPIVIMDEPTSALDARTEQSIQHSIHNYFDGKTLIVIAHRLSTVAVLDEIILLEDGKVKDFGPHESLLKTSVDYKEMWELQTNPQK